jgi:hypothetical protein
MIEKRVVRKMVPKVIQVEEEYEIDCGITEMKTFFVGADTNNDGRLSMGEWQAKGYDSSMFVSCIPPPPSLPTSLFFISIQQMFVSASPPPPPYTHTLLLGILRRHNPGDVCKCPTSPPRQNLAEYTTFEFIYYISSSFLFLLHNHFITEFFFKKNPAM